MIRAESPIHPRNWHGLSALGILSGAFPEALPQAGIRRALDAAELRDLHNLIEEHRESLIVALDEHFSQ